MEVAFSNVVFGRSGFLLRLAAARAAVFFFAAFVGRRFGAERFAAFAFLAVRRRGGRAVLLRLLDLVVRLRVTFDFLATVAPPRVIANGSYPTADRANLFRHGRSPGCFPRHSSVWRIAATTTARACSGVLPSTRALKYTSNSQAPTPSQSGTPFCDRPAWRWSPSAER